MNQNYAPMTLRKYERFTKYKEEKGYIRYRYNGKCDENYKSTEFFWKNF